MKKHIYKILNFLKMSQDSKFFFIILSLYYILFKGILALQMIVVDGYSTLSFMTPPISIIFASEDIIYIYLFSLLTSKMSLKHQHKIYIFSGLFSVILLISDFVIHSYLKTFLNYGLLKFNGAGIRELFNYLLGTFNIFLVMFLLVTTAFLVVLISYKKDFSFYKLKSRTIFIIFITTILIRQIFQTLNAGQEGWLVIHPPAMLFTSSFKELSESNMVEQYDSTKPFTPPQELIYGTANRNTFEEIKPLNKPNILFILTESLPFKHTPLSGNENSPLKILNTMKDNSITFSNFRTDFPATSRSFISYFCGIHPNGGVATVTKYNPGFKCNSIMKTLKESGYRTGFFTSSIFSYDNLHKAEFMKDFDTNKDFFDMLSDSKTANSFSQAVEEELVVKNLKDFMQEDASKPFFALYFAFWDHSPYRLPIKDISSLPPQERYYETLKYLNSIFTDIYQFLKEKEYDKNTIVVFAADHGEAFGEHGAYSHAGHIWEENIHIPLMITLPNINKNIENNSLSSNIDILPTLAYLTGTKKDMSWEGQNLLDNNFKTKPLLIFSRASVSLNGIIDGNFKYFYDLSSNKKYFFDLSSDPLEKNNLSDKEESKIKEYKNIIEKWISYQDYKITNQEKSH